MAAAEHDGLESENLLLGQIGDRQVADPAGHLAETLVVLGDGLGAKPSSTVANARKRDTASPSSGAAEAGGDLPVDLAHGQFVQTFGFGFSPQFGNDHG